MVEQWLIQEILKTHIYDLLLFPDIFFLFSGLTAVLVFSSLLAHLLRWRHFFWVTSPLPTGRCWDRLSGCSLSSPLWASSRCWDAWGPWCWPASSGCTYRRRNSVSLWGHRSSTALSKTLQSTIISLCIISPYDLFVSNRKARIGMFILLNFLTKGYFSASWKVSK